MQCRSCGNELLVGVNFCPTCGVKVSNAEESENALTVASSFPPDPPAHRPATDYGSPSYGVLQPNPYELPNPYAVPLQAPPPPPAHRQVKSRILIGILSGIVVTVLILASVAAFGLLTKRATNTASGNTSPITVTKAQTSITATSTANVEENPYPPYRGTLVLDDPLRDQSRGYGWDEYPVTTYGAACQFEKDGYHVIEQQSYIIACFPTMQFSNFTFEVQMKVVKGNCGGLSFDDSKKSSYHFEVCQDGTYSLYRYDSATSFPVLASGSSSTIKPGLNQSNLIALVAIDNKFDLYVNGQHINSASDSKYHQGFIGLQEGSVLRYYGSTVEVVYSNAKAWTL